ncbi:MAG: hypothetical protein KIS66_09200 [Fimbriimonadaceae bacterium]|nr:hypothetical protein [Fimbriimonadaceae bacterium]
MPHPFRATAILCLAIGAARAWCPTMPQSEPEFLPADLYPPPEALRSSPGGVAYFVNPGAGDDGNDGRSPKGAWRTFRAVNRTRFGPGDQVTILPGIHRETLRPVAQGSRSRPVVIRFARGRHEFRAEFAAKLRRFVSNSADAPHKPWPVGILVQDARHLRFEGAGGSELWLGDRMTYSINERSEGVAFVDLAFDMVRPTVSEFRVLESGPGDAVIRVAEGSTYAIEDGRFAWTGDLGPGWTMVQEADLAVGRCWRRGPWDPFRGARAQELGGRTVRLSYHSGSPGLAAGHQYQFRNVERDTTSLVNDRCRDVLFQDCRFHALPGMGIVSQFCENVTFRRVHVEPRAESTRTCPAWADCFHFSNCRGRVLVDGCRFSGSQDDPINVHGTHLRLLEKTAPDRVVIRYAHPQTYGFAPYQAGDRMAFVSHRTLLVLGDAKVRAAEQRSDRDWEIVLDRPVPPFDEGDVADNATWHPDVTVRGCRFAMDSCRGLLVTSSGKVLVEDNDFVGTTMSAIDIADDANSWYESGAVQDVTIRRNRFLGCGEPVVFIHPEAPTPKGPVHRNIRIVDNLLTTGGISARSVGGLVVRGNRFGAWPPPIETKDCPGALVERNGRS